MTKKQAENEPSVASKKSSRSIGIKKSPKSPATSPAQPLIPEESQNDKPKAKRGRGRPRKNSAVVMAAEKAEKEIQDFQDE